MAILKFTNLIQLLRGFEKSWNVVQNFMITPNCI
jgi:hypothetical protein